MTGGFYAARSWFSLLQPKNMMKKIFARPVDFSKVETLVYHLPDGPSFSMEMNDVAEMFNFDMEFGDICDTSDIDGVLHFFPKGNA